MLRVLGVAALIAVAAILLLEIGWRACVAWLPTVAAVCVSAGSDHRTQQVADERGERHRQATAGEHAGSGAEHGCTTETAADRSQDREHDQGDAGDHRDARVP